MEVQKEKIDPKPPQGWFALFKTAAMDWMDDKAPRLGAALAFYTIFSLGPLLTVVISIAALWYSDKASGQVFQQLASVIGNDSAKSLEEMLAQPPGEKHSGIFTAVSAAVMLVVGATGVFVQLQDSLNEIWEVKPKPGQGVMGFVRHRLLSLAMVMGLAFLLTVSLVMSTALAAMGKYFSPSFGDAQWIFEILNNAVSFGVFAFLFALMFKYVPDAKVAWRDVWIGAVFTAALFVIGKFGLGMYLGKSAVVSTYKAAGALLIVLLWVYYSAQIVFFGAELTQAYASQRGHAVEPSPHAQIDELKAATNDQRADLHSPIVPESPLSPGGAPVTPERPRPRPQTPWTLSSLALCGLAVLIPIFVTVYRKELLTPQTSKGRQRSRFRSSRIRGPARRTWPMQPRCG